MSTTEGEGKSQGKNTITDGGNPIHRGLTVFMSIRFKATNQPQTAREWSRAEVSSYWIVVVMVAGKDGEWEAVKCEEKSGA